MKNIAFIVSFLVFLVCLFPAFGQVEDLLQSSESLTTQGDFYQALVALEPLLTMKQRSYEQEQAFWQANALCETVIVYGDLRQEFEDARKEIPEDRKHIVDPMKQEKIVMLNKWGADIRFKHLAWNYAYHYGFLKRLVEFYPDSERRPAAEYYIIEKAYNEPEPVERWLNDLYLYIDEYADGGLGELYMAYLDIAHINDNLWQLLTYPDGTYNVPFSSGDEAIDKKQATQYKEEALKYYARVIISGYGGRFGYPEWFDTKNRFEELKQDKETRHNWIIYD